MNPPVRSQAARGKGPNGRQVEPELLDSLPADDPRAIQSRKELRRVNAWMRNGAIVARALQAVTSGWEPQILAELGGGDGTLMLQVARQLKPVCGGVALRIVDQQRLLAPETVTQYGSLGWSVEAVQSDAVEWLHRTPPVDLIIANLFLHHFEEAELIELFRRASDKTRGFVACEPRRFSFPRIAGNLVTLIGCGPVTRHDAIASVRAGFLGQELSEMWPKTGEWKLVEAEAGLFSHSFWAKRR